MSTLGVYIYNATRDAWLQDTPLALPGQISAATASWGAFNGAVKFREAEIAEEIRVRLARNDEVAYVMAALH